MNRNEQFDEVKSFVEHHLQESFTKCDEEWKKRFPRSAEYRWQHTLNVLQNKVTLGWCLAHVLAHTANHVGHMQLTRQFFQMEG